MPVPGSVTKIKKDSVEFVSSVDKINYTINELSRAALRDVGKFVCNRARQNIRRRSGRVARNTQYWVRKKETDLQVGFKPGGFYGGFQEVGTLHIRKIGALASAAEDNIDQIRVIEGQYLSAVEDENRALGLVNEGEYLGEDE